MQDGHSKTESMRESSMVNVYCIVCLAKGVLIETAVDGRRGQPECVCFFFLPSNRFSRGRRLSLPANVCCVLADAKEGKRFTSVGTLAGRQSRRAAGQWGSGTD